MAFQVSPGVQFQEIDLTGIVPAVSTSTGGFVGQFVWGPVNEVQSLSSEADLVTFFGKPNATTFTSFFSAANFLSYSTSLNLIRVCDPTANNANPTGSTIQIKNDLDWEANWSTGAGTVGTTAAKYPGQIGTSLKVSMCDNATYINAISGTITAATNSAAILGVGTAFTTQTSVGSYLYTTAGVLIGQILVITDDLHVTLTTNAAVVVAGAAVKAYWEFFGQFNSAPGTTSYATSFGGSNDGIHIVVLDHDGVFTGVPGTILETFAGVSKASDARTDSGVTNYYVKVLETSSYVWWMDHPTNVGAGAAWGSSASNAFASLIGPDSHKYSGGLDGTAVSDAILEAGYALFLNTELIEVDLLITGPWSLNVAQYCVQSIAAVRLDCVAFVSPPLANVYNQAGFEAANVVASRNGGSFNVVSSYGFMDSGWKYQYDRYNDVYRWLPLNPDIAGLAAQTDQTNDPWWSPAGFSRGQIKNVVKLAWSPNQTDRDTLYRNGINPVVNFPGQGVVLYGDKTLLSASSAFDRINVRRLFIVLEKAISIAAKSQLFQINDSFTQAQFRNMIEPFLRDVKGRRGVTDFLVTCDSTNNTGDVVDANQFVADIYIKPSRSINFITLSFVAVRDSVSFTEAVGSGAQ
jgi:phage tail sheath protein FI